ncbi:radical SAM protein [Sorangium cellulosum]|uniref:Radical SAM protein n=1 Tax=Sorangium cellulosum TaxID=56 RepID=A0A2L0EZK7_SORCE|nr:radical SAM protein [Sorangium cellulosum]AUX44752.1 radical SAM protein [Sorangium cellulosum]
MRVALVYPPTCDPTAPYLAVPMLTGFLRAHGVEVLPIDANVEAFDALLTSQSMAGLLDRLETRLAELDRRAALPHVEQLELAALARARGDAHAVPGAIDAAKATFRSADDFFDPDAYARAVATVEAALGVVSATHHPLQIDFTAYRTPFGLTSMAEIARSSRPEHDPFDGWVQQVLVPRLRDAGADIVGLSVCFPGQLQPAYAFAHKIKEALPGVHVTCGGPGVTQMLLRLSGERLARALGPFDSACLFEGEHTLLALARALDERRPLRDVPNVVVRDRLMGARWTSGHGMEDLRALPAPDFDGLPLDTYFAPALVLPYDPTRGCYWGKCTFCHYGLAEVGTAAYRERAVETVVAHVRALAERHRTRHFYFSQDSVAPKTLVKIAQGILDAGLDVRWATDLKPEKYLTQERAEVLRRGGAVACALGVESASPRVLGLIDKGAPVEVVSDVIDHLSGAGIAAEAMCFTDFPTETHAEAVATLDFLGERREALAVYIVGEFGLTHGSLVAQTPERFGIDEVFALEGDELGLGLFFVPKEPWKTDAERADVDARLDALSRGWTLRRYPWAGAVSTAHTILQYDRSGPGVFRELAARRTEGGVPGAVAIERGMRFDPRAAEQAEAREAEIWATLVYEERRVGRDAYEALARALPPLRPRPVRLRFAAGAAPAVTSGRRPSHAASAAR